MEIILDSPMTTQSRQIRFGAHLPTADEEPHFLAGLAGHCPLAAAQPHHFQTRPRFLITDPFGVRNDDTGAQFLPTVTALRRRVRLATRRPGTARPTHYNPPE